MCPLLPVERRLDDSVSLWAEALDAYFDPHKFRVKLQAAIQSFRSVTFVLQAQKSHLAGFDEWYATQQEQMRKDEIMRWLVEARNFIEKQGDLSTRSRFLITFSNSWDDDTAKEYPLAPEVMPQDVAKIIANTIPDAKINDEALLKLERSWVDSLRPHDEVLSSLIHCYLVLRGVIDSAHSIVSPPGFCAAHENAKTHTEVLPLPMRGFSFPRTEWFRVKNGQIVEYEVKAKVITRQEMAEYLVDAPTGVKEAAKTFKGVGTFKETCAAYFNMARAILVNDEYHGPMAFFEAKGMPQFCQLRMDDRAGKHVLFRELADQCRRHDANWFIFIGEAWLAIPDGRHGPHAATYPNRREALCLQGVHHDGTQLQFMALFSRRLEKVTLSETAVIEQPLPGVMNPIVRAIVKSRSV